MRPTDYLIVLALSIVGSWIAIASWVLAFVVAQRIQRRHAGRTLAHQVEQHLRGRRR